MVRVNNEEFTTYELDTRQSIITRIAALMGTLPKYLYFPNGLPEDPLTANNIDVEDLLAEIKENASRSGDFPLFLTSIRKKIHKKMDVEKNILYPWIVYNTELERMAKLGSLILKQKAKSFVDSGYFEDENDFVRFWKTSRDRVKYDLENGISNIEREDKAAEQLYAMFQEIDDEDSLVYTDFVTTKVTIDIDLQLKDITMLEIFNHIVTNDVVPFVAVKEYFKILKDFVPPEEWAAMEGEHMTIKVNSKRKFTEAKLKDYIDVMLAVEGEIGKERVTASMKIHTKPGYLKRDEFIIRFLSIFKGLGDITYDNIKEKSVTGDFYFPAERLNTYVFSDLVMNNQLFSALINIDESSKATKKDTVSGQPWLHIIFNHPSTGRISVSFTQKQVNRVDKDMRETDPEIFVHGEPYINVHVSTGRDRRAVEIFQLMLSKLLVIYGQQYNEIVEFYEQYLPDFGTIEEYEVPLPKSKQGMVAPGIFVSKYSRNCSPPERMPTVLTSQKKAKKYEKRGKQIMAFPRPEQEQPPHYPSDGGRQLYFVCKNPKYPFPGLQRNTLGNADDYPYVPCCYATDQSKAGGSGSGYREYFFNDFTEPTEKRQQGLISSKKILHSDQYGELSKDLDKLFNVLETTPNYQFIRIGVHRNKSSFLNAVMLGLHEQTNILDFQDEEEREAHLLQIREKLSKPSNAVMARQCCYDMTLEQVQTAIADPDRYFDPRKFIQLLEGFFNCNIYLFNPEKMFLPDFIQSYYDNKRKNVPYVFIFEHRGSESDHARYPQCELIVRWNTKRSVDTEFSLTYKNPVAKSVDNIFQLLKESYALNRPITDTVFSWPDEITIDNQVIDSYGKTRRVNIRYKDQPISIITSPIPPIPVNELVEPLPLSVVNGKTAMSLLKVFNAHIDSQTVQMDQAKEINATVGNVNITIPIMEQEPFDDLPHNKLGLHNPESKTSTLQIYNRNKKLARYITEYVLWLFSRYLIKKGQNIVTDKLLSRFAKKNIKIDKNFKYGKVPKIFSMNSGVMSDGKLVVTSEDMLKRVMYVLKLYSIRDIRSLVNYHTRNVITHYYVDITDFNYNPRQVILYGDDAVDKWIQENRYSHVLNNKVVVGKRTPYFFKNQLVEDQVFLAQNVDTLNKAFSVANTWYRKGYNPGINVSAKRKAYNFILYVYVNDNDIAVRNIVGSKSPKDTIRILGYKLRGHPSYTVLLEL